MGLITITDRGQKHAEIVGTNTLADNVLGLIYECGGSTELRDLQRELRKVSHTKLITALKYLKNAGYIQEAES